MLIKYIKTIIVDVILTEEKSYCSYANKKERVLRWIVKAVCDYNAPDPNFQMSHYQIF